MIKRISLLMCLTAGSLLCTAQTGSKSVELKDVFNGTFYARGAGYGMRATADGEHYTLISPKRDAILRYSFATGKLVDTLFYTKNTRECQFESFDDYQISSDGRHILIYTDTESIYRRSSRANVHHYESKRRLVKPLSDTAGKVMIPTLSPNGRMVAFVRDNNIFIKKFDFDTEVQVTTDGKRNHIINGTTDWVYEEEFESTRLMSWSEDGAYLAYVKSDESAVPEYRMPMYGQRLYPQDYVYKYPKAGEPNSKVSLHVYNVTDRSQKKVNISEEDAYYIPRISYIGRDQNLAVMTLNRRQNHLRIFYVNSKTLLPKVAFQEESKTYIDGNNLQKIEFTPTGFAYLSERSGYQHLYLISDRGQVQRQVTDGKWDVTEFYGIDAMGNAYYQAADEHPTERNIYRMDTKGKASKLTSGRGMHQGFFSNGFKYYVGSFSSLTEPTTTAVFRTGETKPLRVLEDNTELRKRLKNYQFGNKEIISVRLADGTVLNGWMLKPVNFDPQKKYPLFMTQYSGPNSQQVLNQYSFGWEHYLASQGFIVACVDGRGTGARGEEWRKCTYLKLGVQESLDQAAAARSLGDLPFVDEKRIGIFGWSFGGYNTLMSLIHGNGAFKLGIAVAPVTDWRYYDTIYTERFMRTPKENPEGYKVSSVLTDADKLKGRLLLIHGSADDNVHMQNSMDLIDKLVSANIPFDMAIYTDKDHSIRGGNTSLHIYTKMAQYLMDHL